MTSKLFKIQKWMNQTKFSGLSVLFSFFVSTGDFIFVYPLHTTKAFFFTVIQSKAKKSSNMSTQKVKILQLSIPATKCKKYYN